jgi:hypothetical protein
MNLLKEVFSKAVVESSSDFIVTLYEVAKRTNHEMLLKIDPIYRWEFMNWHDGWESNVNFIGQKMKSLDQEDYAEIHRSYTDILEYFLNNSTLDQIFKMDTRDHIGWKIYKELSEKRILCAKMAIIERLSC